MSRQIRLEFPGALYHVTQRGNNQQNIFLDDADRNVFLELLGESVERFAWILTSYVLMTNHFHFVIQLTCASLSIGMRWLDTEYPRYFNRRYRRVGHLYQRRFDGRLVEKETYSLNVLRYDALNPWRAGMVARPEDYAWSSHRAVLGLAKAPDWLAVDDLLVQFAPQRDLANANYKNFVDAAIGVDCNPWKDLVGNMYLGSKAWIERVREQVQLKPRCDDHPRAQRLVDTAPMSAIIAGVASCLSIDEERVRYHRGGVPRMLAAWIACNETLLTNRQIAAGLRLRSSSRVSQLVRDFDRQLDGNEVLQGWVDRCVSTIRGKSSQL
ncbi:MAG TPA: transposase [Thermoanaerobaculia bacterium]|nr:transposase [Thermoanaerobaculia bacterium]